MSSGLRSLFGIASLDNFGDKRLLVTPRENGSEGGLDVLWLRSILEFQEGPHERTAQTHTPNGRYDPTGALLRKSNFPYSMRHSEETGFVHRKLEHTPGRPLTRNARSSNIEDVLALYGAVHASLSCWLASYN